MWVVVVWSSKKNLMCINTVKDCNKTEETSENSLGSLLTAFSRGKTLPLDYSLYSTYSFHACFVF